MSLMKKSLIYAVIIFLIFSLSNRNDKKDTEFEPIMENAMGWEFIIEDYQLNDSLEDIRTTVDYEGVSTSNEVTVVPQEGKTFLLIKMVIEKKDGSETIDWNNMSLLHSSGTTYSRLDDTFLEDFGFKRMKGTTLSFGKNEGWIAFEVDENSTDFKLQYDSSEGIISIDLAK